MLPSRWWVQGTEPVSFTAHRDGMWTARWQWGVLGLRDGLVQVCCRGLWLQRACHYPDSSKVCYPRCLRTTSRAHVRSKLTFAKDAVGKGRDYPPRPAQLGIYDKTILCGYFWPLPCSPLSLFGLLQRPFSIHSCFLFLSLFTLSYLPFF